ncbi:LAFE_0H16006g1_1 [Lachancea fermentati]|uniref:Alkyl transferase n=1 Tax=Lachancea fermentati TaxID=4955 RepID=A0A1G4ML80_LACFM|nr:LAFE_0H16006g1_1 [Lachancea fermentati]
MNMKGDSDDLMTENGNLTPNWKEPLKSDVPKMSALTDWEGLQKYMHYQRTRIWRSFLAIFYINWIISTVQNLMLDILMMGPLPRHVSFIMDGNRRYAKSLGQPIKYGHESGALTLMKIVTMCKKLGIKTVSVYAFSIENFNRPPDEVNTLTSLLAEKLNYVAERAIDVKSNLYGLRLRVVGERSMISKELNDKITNVERMTDEGEDIVLYICFPYTSRNDIFHAIYDSVEKCKYHALPASSLDVSKISSEMFFDSSSDKCDLVIRTSGRTRLSDFMLWQVHENGIIEFSETLWPDFSFWEFFVIILKWSFFTCLQTKELTGFSLRKNALGFAKQHLWLHRFEPVVLEELPDPPEMVSIIDRS